MSSGPVNGAFVVFGLVLVVVMLADAFDTLIATRIRSNRWWPTDIFYRAAWKTWRWICVKVHDDGRREQMLAVFGPLSLVALLAMWTLGQILGWSLVWWGLREHFDPSIARFGTSIYYSGVVYFSIGFGDVLPVTGALRVLTILEAFGGLGTLGMVIGFLPSLNSAYQARETQLLLLDDLGDTRITPASLTRSHIPIGRRAGDAGYFDEVDGMFRDWERWCAEVFESHTSFPMLVLFRSQHRGHSWVTAQGVVTDSAIAYLAAVEGAEHSPAHRLYRQSCRTVRRLAERLDIRPEPYRPLPAHLWSIGYSAMQDMGLELRPFDESYTRINELRAQFHPYMEVFIDELLAPRGFWGVTAADHLAEARFNAFEDETGDPTADAPPEGGRERDPLERDELSPDGG